jgi:microcystin-dependent protein
MANQNTIWAAIPSPGTDGQSLQRSVLAIMNTLNVMQNNSGSIVTPVPGGSGTLIQKSKQNAFVKWADLSNLGIATPALRQVGSLWNTGTTGSAISSGTILANVGTSFTNPSPVSLQNLASSLSVYLKPFSTGDIKPTYKTVPDTGWLMMADNFTIGSAGSLATFADPSALNLFTLLWNNITNDSCPVIPSGRGASAAADWAANQAITLPLIYGRALTAAGAGTGLTVLNLGSAGGENNHTLTVAEMPSHAHTITDPGHHHLFAFTAETNTVTAGTTAGAAINNSNTNNATTGITIVASGGGGAHNNMQPFAVVNFMISL